MNEEKKRVLKQAFFGAGFGLFFGIGGMILPARDQETIKKQDSAIHTQKCQKSPEPEACINEAIIDTYVGESIPQILGTGVGLVYLLFSSGHLFISGGHPVIRKKLLLRKFHLRQGFNS